jgi:molybdate transport system substrate-binding protein
MASKSRIPRCCAGLVLAACCAASAAEERAVRVAAAADLQTAMPEIVSAFRRETGFEVDVTYGSSGNFVAQIENGAPLDVFFSADRSYPEKLRADGFAEKGRVYGVGKIVLWVPEGSPLRPERDGWSALVDPSVERIAIANPEHAPYGRAAVAALAKAGFYERVKPKLVYGENVAQAAQFVQSGNAQAGILARSLTFSPGLRKGKSWEVPPGLYAPIEQSVAVLKRARDNRAAQEFVRFVVDGPGSRLLAKSGFEPPPGRPE